MAIDFSQVTAVTIPEGDVTKIEIGGVEVWRKLPYDAEVEWLESTGTQYIDTGVNGGSDLSISVRALRTTGSGMIFGAIYRPVGGTSTRCALQCDASTTGNGVFRYYSDTNTTSLRFPAIYNTPFDASADYAAGTFAINTSSSSRSVATYSQPITIYLLARNKSLDGVSSVDFVSASGYRIYSAKIYVSGTLVRDYIPVRVGSGANAVGYLYDRANPTGGPLGNGLYGNSGSGAFAVGPDAN